MSKRPSLPARLAIGCIRVYQRILSRLLGQRCRFYPTCSCYAIEAIAKKGIIKGGAMTCWRILRCNPFTAGGYDPVEKKGTSAAADKVRGRNGA